MGHFLTKNTQGSQQLYIGNTQAGDFLKNFSTRPTYAHISQPYHPESHEGSVVTMKRSPDELALQEHPVIEMMGKCKGNLSISVHGGVPCIIG